MWVFKTGFGHKTTWRRKQFIFIDWISNTCFWITSETNQWGPDTSCFLILQFSPCKVWRQVHNSAPWKHRFGVCSLRSMGIAVTCNYLQSLVRNIQVQPPPARNHPHLLLQGSAPLIYWRHVGPLWIWVPWWTQSVTAGSRGWGTLNWNFHSLRNTFTSWYKTTQTLAFQTMRTTRMFLELSFLNIPTVTLT